MFTLTDSLFYQNPPKVKMKHILPQIGEVEDFDIEWEFQQADIGDIFDIINTLLGGGVGGGAGGAGGAGAGGAGAGGADGAGADGIDLDKMIRNYEEYLRRRKELESREREIIENLIKTFTDLHRAGLEFGEMLGNMTKTLGNIVYTTSPTLGALGEGLASFAREASSVSKALGAIPSNIVGIIDSFQKASSALESLQLRFPFGPPPLPPVAGFGFGFPAPQRPAPQQPAPQPPGATRPLPPAVTQRLPMPGPGQTMQLPSGLPTQILGGVGIPTQLLPQLGQITTSIGRFAAALGPLATVLAAVVAAVIIFAQSLQMLLSILGTLVGILNNIIQTIERGTQVMSIWERWRLAFSQFMEGAAAGEQAWSRFVNMFSQFGTTLDELAQSLRTALGDISIMAAQGRVSLEAWAQMLGEIGRLGVRAGQQAEVLRAALEGRIREAGGLGLPTGTAEAIAMLQYGVAGMGETAARAATAMSVLQMQIDYLSQQTTRAGQAIYAYNQIVGRLQTLYEEAGREILERLAAPLQLFARIIQSTRVEEALQTIAAGIGNFAAAFVGFFEPFFVDIVNLINERAASIRAALSYIGAALGEALGVGLKAIVDFLTSPRTLAGFAGFATFLNGLVETLSGIVRVLGPGLVAIFGLLAHALGIILKVIGLFLNLIAEIGRIFDFFYNLIVDRFLQVINIIREKIEGFLNWLRERWERARQLPIVGRIIRAGEELWAGMSAVARGVGNFLISLFQQLNTAQQLNAFNRALEDLKQTLNDNQQAALLAKRALEALSQEAGAMAENYRKIQQTMQELSALFTPAGVGAIWAPFREVFRALTQATALTPTAAAQLRQAGILTGGPALEQALEFRIPTLQPIPVGFAEWAGVQVQAALREIDARIVQLATSLATLNRQMAQTGYTINATLLQYYQQLAQAIRNLVTQLENINRQMQEMVRGLREAYEITETWLRLRWGLEDLMTAGRYLENVANISERLLVITRARVEAQMIEAQRAAQFLGLVTATVRQQLVSLRRAGVDIGIEPEQFDPLRMVPVRVAQIMQALGMPYPLINLTIQAIRQLQQAWVEVIEAWRRGGEEIANTASTFRQFHEEVMKTSARFGDTVRTFQAGIQVLASFDRELQGLAMRAAAALAAGRMEEYIRTLQEGWRRFVERFDATIEVIRRGIEAAFQPLNLYIDRFEMMSRALERVGAQALLIPQLLTQIIPIGLQYLRILEQMAQQYREHPLMLQAIFQTWEQWFNRIMGLLGQAAGGILPAIPLSELARISQMPTFSPREMARWAREGGPVPFAPEVRMMGIPITPAYLLAWPFHLGARTYLAESDIAQFLLSPMRMLPLIQEFSVQDIREQLRRDFLRFIVTPFEAWRRVEIPWQGFQLRQELDRRIFEAFQQGIMGGRAGLMRERVPLPGFEGVAPWQPALEIPPQAMEVPVRLRLQLDNNKIPLEIQIKRPDGTYEVIPKVIEVTPITPEDIARRNPPTTGTQ